MVRMMNGNMRPMPHTAGVGNEKKVDKGALNQKSPSRSGIEESKVKKDADVKTYSRAGEERAFDHKEKGNTSIGREKGGGGDHLRKEHPIKFHDRGPHQHKGGKYKV